MPHMESLNLEKFVEENLQAEQAITSQNLPDAARLLVSIIEKDPGNWRAYNNLGVISWIRKYWIDAHAMFRRAVECNPVYVDALMNLFDASLKLKKIPELIPLLKKALDMDQNLEDIRRISDFIEDAGSAIYYSERAQSIGVYSAVCDDAEQALRCGDNSKAMELFLKVLDSEGPDARAFCGLGIISFYLEKYDDAFKLFEESIKMNPADTDTFLNLLDCAKKCNKVETAVQIFNNYKSHYPGLLEISDQFETII